MIGLRALFCRTLGPFPQSWRPRLRNARARGRRLLQLEHCGDKRLAAFVRINALAKFPSHCPIGCAAPHSSSIGYLRRRPGRSQCSASTRLGRIRPGGIDGDMTSDGGWAATVLNADIAIRFAFSSRPAGAGFARAQPGFASPVFGRLAWRYSTVNEGVTRFNGILKISET